MAAGRLWTGLGQHQRTENFNALLRSMVAFSALSLAPDLDVIAFRFGIPYAAPFGHRGAAHSIFVALVLASIAAVATRLKRESKRLSPDAYRTLCDHEWRGNVRELEKTVKRMVVLADDGETLGLESLPAEIRELPGVGTERSNGHSLRSSVSTTRCTTERAAAVCRADVSSPSG